MNCPFCKTELVEGQEFSGSTFSCYCGKDKILANMTVDAADINHYTLYHNCDEVTYYGLTYQEYYYKIYTVKNGMSQTIIEEFIENSLPIERAAETLMRYVNLKIFL